MKQILRRLSRLSDSAGQYEPLRRPGKQQQQRKRPLRGDHSSEQAAETTAAYGRVPVYVGEEMVRFELPTELLNRPAFVELLRHSAEEYGYSQQGVLRIPCPIDYFRQALASAASAGGSVGLSPEEDEQLLQYLDEGQDLLVS